MSFSSSLFLLSVPSSLLLSSAFSCLLLRYVFLTLYSPCFCVLLFLSTSSFISSLFLVFFISFSLLSIALGLLLRHRSSLSLFGPSGCHQSSVRRSSRCRCYPTTIQVMSSCPARRFDFIAIPTVSYPTIPTTSLHFGCFDHIPDILAAIWPPSLFGIVVIPPAL